MDNVVTHECFPTLIHEYKFEPSNEKQMVNHVYALDNEGGLKKNNLQTDEVFTDFANYTSMLCGKILHKYDYEYESLEFTNMWGNILRYGSIHPPHNHSNNILSGVWFLQTTKNSSPLQFFDPRPQASGMFLKNKPNWYNSNMISFPVSNGLGLIFPSFMWHWVPQMKVRGDERISISWNMIARGDYGNPNTLQNARI